jgi:hypothetical protein
MFIDSIISEDTQPGTVEEEIEEKSRTLEEIVPASPYLVLGAGLAPDKESSVSIVVMHYLDSTLAQADLEIRGKAAVAEISLAEDEPPYSKRFSVEEARVIGNDLVLRLRQHRATDELYRMLWDRDLLFGACPVGSG